MKINSRTVQYWIIVALILLGLFVKAQVPTQVVCAIRHTPNGIVEQPIHISQEGKVLLFRTSIDNQNRWLTFSPEISGNTVQSANPNLPYESNMYFRMQLNRGVVTELEICDGGSFVASYGVAFGVSNRVRQWE